MKNTETKSTEKNTEPKFDVVMEIEAAPVNARPMLSSLRDHKFHVELTPENLRLFCPNIYKKVSAVHKYAAFYDKALAVCDKKLNQRHPEFGVCRLISMKELDTCANEVK